LVAHGQDRVALVEIGGSVRAVAAVGQQQVRGRGRRLELRVDTPFQAITRGVERLRSAQAQEPRHVRKVDLPAARDHHVAAPHEESVARVDGRIGIRSRSKRRARGAIEVGDRHGVAAVDDVEDDAPVAPGAIDRQQDRHVRLELDTARMVARRERHVGDALVRRVLGVDREVERPLQLLVRADVAERRAAGERPPESYVEAGHRHRALSTIFGKISEIEPRTSTSASSSISVGSALRMTTRAPARLATGTTPAIGYTDSFVPTASIRSQLAAACWARKRSSWTRP
jgi:hypothetical protein